MTTKRQAVAALRKHCEGATLIDNDSPLGYDVELEAPKNHHWEGDVHSRCVGFWYSSNNKSEYWDEVIEVIKELPTAILCSNNDCEGVAAWGECEYWSKDE